ncbi:sulfurtransferase complex subunit TusC [Gallaecimonas sp. GXIMD4217]|uniref:sulfurtransferase complex subunit TusC n=1 Tax=Gallaecimonas sp. GXIMD4217 TaxID=3131927 RepID=UPI00311B09F8
MVSKQIALVMTRAPFAGHAGREGLDAALVAAAYEQELCLCFIGDAVWQLLPQQEPALAHSKDYLATLKALPLYEVERLHVCAASLAERGIEPGEIRLPVEVLAPEALAGLLKQQDAVYRF